MLIVIAVLLLVIAIQLGSLISTHAEAREALTTAVGVIAIGVFTVLAILGGIAAHNYFNTHPDTWQALLSLPKGLLSLPKDAINSLLAAVRIIGLRDTVLFLLAYLSCVLGFGAIIYVAGQLHARWNAWRKHASVRSQAIVIILSIAMFSGIVASVLAKYPPVGLPLRVRLATEDAQYRDMLRCFVLSRKCAALELNPAEAWTNENDPDNHEFRPLRTLDLAGEAANVFVTRPGGRSFDMQIRAARDGRVLYSADDLYNQVIFAARKGDDIYLIQEGWVWGKGEARADFHHESLIVWKWDATGRVFERTGIYTTRARYFWQEGGSVWEPMDVAWQPVAAQSSDRPEADSLVKQKPLP